MGAVDLGVRNIPVPTPTDDPSNYSASWLRALNEATPTREDDSRPPSQTLAAGLHQPPASDAVAAPSSGAQPKPAGTEQHSGAWWWLHDHGLANTKHENADILRRAYGLGSGLIVRDKDGTPINVDQMSDDEVIALDHQLRGKPIGHEAAGAATLVTPWGWQGSRQYKEAVRQLKQAGTHETLNGKVPTWEEATRMIAESGGKVVRQDPGHPPSRVSTHHEPHINYTTPDGSKATVIVREN